MPSKETCVRQLEIDFPPQPRRKKPFNLNRLILNSKIIAVEAVSLIVFFVWLFRIFVRELRQ